MPLRGVRGQKTHARRREVDKKEHQARQNGLVRKQLSTLFNQLVMTTGTKAEIYEFTNVIGTWARAKGYKGLIVPGARGSQNYTNIIIFKQSDLTSALSGITPIKLK